MLRIHLLDRFAVHRDGKLISENATWGMKKKHILQLLLVDPGYPVSRDFFIDVLYDDPKRADNPIEKSYSSFNSRVSELRRILEPNLQHGLNSAYILTTDGGYAFNKAAIDNGNVWLDTIEFLRVVKQASHSKSKGDFDSALRSYNLALSYFGKGLLPENQYEDWMKPHAEDWHQRLINTLNDAIDCAFEAHRFSDAKRYANLHIQIAPYAIAPYECLLKCAENTKDLALLQETLQSASDNFRNNNDDVPDILLESYSNVISKIKSEETSKENLSLVTRDMMILYAVEDRSDESLAIYRNYLSKAEKLGVNPDPKLETIYLKIRDGQIPQTRTVQNNLDRLHNQFVGRHNEIEKIQRILNNPQIRLLTITGISGIGKTRLALEIGHQLLEQYADQVFQIVLSKNSTRDEVIYHLISALDLNLEFHEQPLIQVIKVIREKKLLLIIDGYEQQPYIPELIDEILKGTTECAIVVTALIPLDLITEYVFYLGGLNYVSPKDSKTESSNEAIEFFLQCAERVNVDMQLNLIDKVKIANICQFLEGHPMFIQLAASWITSLSPEQILRHISSNISSLKGSTKAVPAHQRNLESMFNKTLSLLSTRQQEILARLSLFPSGFSLDAASQIVNIDAQNLKELTDWSLNIRQQDRYFFFHDLLRQHIYKGFQQSRRDFDHAMESYSFYFADYAHEQTSVLENIENRSVLDEMEAELKNILTAWQWSIQNAAQAIIPNFIECLELYYVHSNRDLEGEKAFEQAANEFKSNQDLAKTSLIRGLIIAGHAKFLNRVGKNSQAEEAFLSAKAIFAKKGSKKQIANCEINLGSVYQAMDKKTKAWDCYQRSREIGDLIRDDSIMGHSLHHLAVLSANQGDYVAGRNLHKQALRIHQNRGNLKSTANSLTYLASLEYRAGNSEKAKQYLHKARPMTDKLKNERMLVTWETIMGSLEYEQGDYEAARERFSIALDLAREVACIHQESILLNNLAAVCYELADYDQSEKMHRESYNLCREIGNLSGEARSLNNLADIATTKGDFKKANSLFLKSLRIRKDLNHKYGIARCLKNLSYVALKSGKSQQASAYIYEALSLAIELASEPQILNVLEGLAKYLIQEGDYSKALEVVAFCLANPKLIDTNRREIEKCLTELREKLQKKFVESSINAKIAIDTIVYAKKILRQEAANYNEF